VSFLCQFLRALARTLGTFSREVKIAFIIAQKEIM